jgi:signal transduction histidine kinase
MRSEFVASVTHELKTPIATIRALGDTLVSGRVPDAADRQEYARLVVQEAKRLARLIDNLLAYARVTDVADVYRFEAVALAGAVADVLGGFRTQLTSGGFEVQVSIPEGLPAARADRTALHLLLENLVDNAIRYSRNERRLEISARPAAGEVELSVIDRGIGIPEDEIEKVASRFFRGRHAVPGGSGLGLAIASRIAEDHGGKLQLRSGVDLGTTVTVRLPVAP